MQVSIIIPALNEAESIASVLANVQVEMQSMGLSEQDTEILVVDGGSQDGTSQLASQAGAKVLYQSQRGYGRACATGLQAAQGKTVVFMDADGADDPRHLHALVQPVQEGRADMVLGSRLAVPMDTGIMPWHQLFGNQVAAWLFRLIYRLPITDLSPFRAADRRALQALGLQEMTYGWPTEMIAKAARQNWRILEIPVIHRTRLGGRSKISGTLKGSLLASYFILSTIFKYAFQGTDSS
jgi:glycosyltransferase involved in cell wall biosynthesis